MTASGRTAGTNQRYLKYDLIRVIAVCTVLIGHISAYMVVHFPEPSGAAFRTGIIFDCIGAVCIPLFLMLSGALLLDEKRSFHVGHCFRRNYVSIALSLAFWLTFYAAWRGILLPVLKGNPPDTHVFFRYFLVFDGDFPHLWYLFMLLGIYPAVPILRLFVKTENRRYILGIILFALLVRFIPFNAGILTSGSEYSVQAFMDKFYIQYVSEKIAYLLIGWYLSVFPPAGMKKALLITAGAAAACGNMLLILRLMAENPDILGFISNKSTTMLLYGAALFTLLLSVCKEKTTENQAVRLLSDASFGIYIMRVLVLEILTELLLPYEAFHGHSPLLYILALFAVTGIVSFGIVLALSRVSGLRRLLHYRG